MRKSLVYYIINLPDYQPRSQIKKILSNMCHPSILDHKALYSDHTRESSYFKSNLMHGLHGLSKGHSTPLIDHSLNPRIVSALIIESSVTLCGFA